MTDQTPTLTPHEGDENDALGQVYRRIVALDCVSAETATFETIWGTAPEFAESFALQAALVERAKAGDARASFYLGALAFGRGERHAENTRSGAQLLVAMVFKDALREFTRASTAGIAAASWNLGVMFERGYGVDSAPRTAAEWFALAAAQYLAADDLAEARAVVAQLARLVPDHLRLPALRERLGRGT